MTSPLRLPIGIHDSVPAAQYHADPAEEPSLSSSLAQVLLEKTPKHVFCQHPRLGGTFRRVDNSKFDLGTVAHELILGRGGGYEVIDAEDWRKGAVQKQRDEARDAGLTPILAKDFERARRMHDAVMARLEEIPGCEGIFKAGVAERVLIWLDVGGALCRGMIDHHGPSEADVIDLKTTGVNLSDWSISSLIDSLGYDMKSAFYLRGLTTLLPELAGRFKWRWVFCETQEPFEVRVIEPSAEMLATGDRKAALAVEKWRRCLEANDWPGYPAEVTRIEPRSGATARWLETELTDDDSLNMRAMVAPVRTVAPELMGPV